MFVGHVDLHGGECVSKPDRHLSGTELDRPSRTEGVTLSTRRVFALLSYSRAIFIF